MGPAVGTAPRQGTHREQAASQHPSKAPVVSDRVPGREEAWHDWGLLWPPPPWMLSLGTPLSLGLSAAVTHTGTQPRGGPSAPLSSKPLGASVPSAIREGVALSCLTLTLGAPELLTPYPLNT